jgi:nuclear pore complex protein Nup54
VPNPPRRDRILVLVSTFANYALQHATLTRGTGGSSFSFGNNTASQPATSNTGTGLFGQPSAQPSTQPTGLFGANNTSNVTGTTGGLFGAAAAPATGGGLFGSTTTQPPTQTQTTGGLFGSTTTAPGLFGNTQANPTAQPSTGLFGSTVNTQPAAGGGLFGARPAGTNSLFGQTTAGPPATGFGQTMTQSNPLAQSTLTASALGQPQQPQNTNNLQVSVFGTPGAAGQTLEQRIENIAQAWNPTSPSCRFQVGIAFPGADWG